MHALNSAYESFRGANRWGSVDFDAMLAGFGDYVDWNEVDGRWVARIAAAFRAAGGDGAIKGSSENAVERSAN